MHTFYDFRVDRRLISHVQNNAPSTGYRDTVFCYPTRGKPTIWSQLSTGSAIMHCLYPASGACISHPVAKTRMSDYFYTSLSPQAWQYRDRRKSEVGIMSYSFRMTSRVLYSAQDHRQH